MHPINKYLRILRSLKPCEIRRIDPPKVYQPVINIINKWVLPFNILAIDLVNHVLGMYSDGIFHLGHIFPHLSITQPRRVNRHSHSFNWSLG